jgi:putative FmdB family regulatory protein
MCTKNGPSGVTPDFQRWRSALTSGERQASEIPEQPFERPKELVDHVLVMRPDIDGPRAREPWREERLGSIWCERLNGPRPDGCPQACIIRAPSVGIAQRLVRLDNFSKPLRRRTRTRIWMVLADESAEGASDRRCISGRRDAENHVIVHRLDPLSRNSTVGSLVRSLCAESTIDSSPPPAGGCDPGLRIHLSRCHTAFEVARPMSESATAVACPSCGSSNTERTWSTVFAKTSRKS